MTSPVATWKRSAVALLVALALAACSRGDDPGEPRPCCAPLSASPLGPAAPPPRALSAAAQAGKRLFFEKGLSASGSMACATCHDPDHAYGPPDDLPVQLGGPQGTSPGLRAVP